MLRSEIYISWCYSLFFLCCIYFLYSESRIVLASSICIYFIFQSFMTISQFIIHHLIKGYFDNSPLNLFYFFFFYFSHFFSFIFGNFYLLSLQFLWITLHAQIYDIISDFRTSIMFSFLCETFLYLCETYFSILIQKLTSSFLYVNYYFFLLLSFLLISLNYASHSCRLVNNVHLE